MISRVESKLQLERNHWLWWCFWIIQSCLSMEFVRGPAVANFRVEATAMIRLQCNFRVKWLSIPSVNVTGVNRCASR